MAREEERVGGNPLRGMNDRWMGVPDQPELLENVYLDDEGCWRTCGGYGQVADIFDNIGAIHSLVWFRTGGRKWLVFEYESSDTLTLAYVDFSGGSGAGVVTTLQTGRTLVAGPNPGTTYWSHSGWLWILNGRDTPIRWNGRDLIQIGFLQNPPSPTVSISGYDQGDASYNTAIANENWSYGWQRGVGAQETSGGGRDDSRYLYGYAISWQNDLGEESPRSEIVWVSGKNTNTTGTPNEKRGVGSINVEFPKAPAHVVGAILWRTVNTFGLSATTGAPVYEVARIQTGGKVHYVDDSPDYDLVVRYDSGTRGLFPPRARYITMFKGVAFVDDGEQLRYSAPGFPGVMPGDNYFPLGDSRAGGITGLKTARNAVVACKSRGIYLIKGDPRDDFYSETVTEDEGNSAPRCLVELPGIGVVFMNEGGIKVLVGALENEGTQTRIERLRGVEGTWRKRVNKGALVSARAARHLRDREIWFQVPMGGDDRPRLGLILHEGGFWSTRTDFPFSCLAEGHDHRSHLYGGSWDTTANSEKGIHVFSRGYDMNGTALASVVRSAWLNLGRRAQPKEVELGVLNIGRTYTVKWHVDRDVANFKGPKTTATRLYDTERKRNVWGGSGTWEPLVPVLRRDAVEKESAFEFQFQLAGAKLAVLGYNLVVTMPSDRKKRSA